MSGTIKVRVDFEFSEEEFDILLRESIMNFGYMRVEPRKAWNIAEKKDCVKHALKCLIDLHHDSKVG